MNELAIDRGRHEHAIRKQQQEVDFCMVVPGITPIFLKPVFEFKVVLDTFFLDACGRQKDHVTQSRLINTS